MTNTLVLIRHGESCANVHPDFYMFEEMNFLSSLGELQAKIAGVKLWREELMFPTMISSGLIRAKQTLSIIAREIGDWQRSYHNDERLNEWYLPHWIDENGIQMPKEKQESFEKRVRSAFEDTIMPALEKGNVICATHNYTMMYLLELLKVDLEKLLGRGQYIPNAIPFIYTGDPDKIVILGDDKEKRRGY